MEFITIAGSVTVDASKSNLDKLKQVSEAIRNIKMQDGFKELVIQNISKNLVAFEVMAEGVISGFADLERPFRDLMSIVTRDSRITVSTDINGDPWSKTITMSSLGGSSM